MKHKILTASTLLHRLVLSIELSTVQTGTGKVARLGNLNILRLPSARGLKVDALYVQIYVKINVKHSCYKYKNPQLFSRFIEYAINFYFKLEYQIIYLLQ